MMVLGRAEGVITLDINDLTGKAAAANAALGSIGQRGTTGFDRLESQLNSVGLSTDRVGMGFLGLGAAMLAPMGIGIKNAIDLEHQMKGVQIALGDVSDHDFGKLQQQIMDIGMNGEFSATEIAVMAEELAKAGYSIEAIMSGDPAEGFGNMAQAVSDLASATGDGLGPATEAITVSMATWSEQIVGTDKALTDANKAADVFTIAANESRASVSDITSGFRNFAPTAALMGVSFEEAAASIATFTNYGLTAREAGTSLTRALTVLADPTSEASALMTELGIAAFDAQGNFVGMPNLMGQLEDKMGGMSQQAKLAALSTIFGAEAMDVMGLAVLGAGGDVQDMIDIMLGGDGYVSAADQAKGRTDTLRGSLERLSEGLNTALAMMAQGLIGPIRMIADGLDFLIGAFSKLPQPILSAIGLVITGLGLLATAIGGFLIFGPRIARFMQTARLMSQLPGILGGSATAFLRVTSALRMFLIAGAGLGAVIAIIAGMVKLNILGFGDAWDRATEAFSKARESGSLLSAILRAIAAALRSFDIGVLDTMADWLGKASVAANAFWNAFNMGAGGGKKDMQDVVDMTNLQIQAVDDASGTDGKRYLLMETNVDTGELEETGEIIESHDDPNDPSRWWARVKVDGEEYEAYIDKETGTVTQIPVEIDASKVPSTMDRLRNGFESLRDMGKTLNMPFLENIGQWGMNGVDALTRFKTSFNGLLRQGVNPLSAGFFALSNAFDAMGWDTARDLARDFSDVLDDLPIDTVTKGVRKLADKGLDLLGKGFDRVQEVGSELWDGIERGASTAWDVIGRGRQVIGVVTDTFQTFMRRGYSPFEAGIKTLTRLFPGLEGPINVARSALSNLRSAFSSLMDLDFSGFWDGLKAAFSDVGSVFDGLGDTIMDGIKGALEGLGGLSDWLADWVADLFGGGDATYGGAGQGRFGAGLSDAMREDLEAAAKQGWSDAWDNFKSWLGDRIVDIGSVTLRIGGWLVDQAQDLWTTVSNWIMERIGGGNAAGPEGGYSVGDVAIAIGGWIVSAGEDLWGTVSDWIMARINGGGVAGGGGAAAGALGGGGYSVGDVAIAIGGWIITSSVDLWDAVVAKVRSWIAGNGVSGGGLAASGALGGGGGIPLGVLSAHVENVLITLAKATWESSAREKVDRAWEDAVGKTITYSVLISLDIGIKIIQDPLFAAKAALIATLGALFVGLAVSVGLAPALAVFGIPLLAYSIYQAAKDYFDRNPLELGRIKAKLSDFWIEVTSIPVLGPIIEAIGKLVEAGWRLISWLHNLPGPAGAAVDAIEKLGLAIMALFAVARIGGMGTRAGKSTHALSFIEGLMRGIKKILAFPFKAIRHPVAAIKELLDLGGRGAGGGKRVRLTVLDVIKGYIKLPFRVASLGIKSFFDTIKTGVKGISNVTKGLTAFSKGFVKGAKAMDEWKRVSKIFGPLDKFDEAIRAAGKPLGPFRRGLQGLWKVMANSKGAVGKALKGIDSFHGGLRKLGEFIGSTKIGKRLGGMLITAEKAIASVASRMWKPVSMELGRIGMAVRPALRAMIPEFKKAAPGIGKAFSTALNASLGGIPSLMKQIGAFSAWAFREGILPIIKAAGSSISGVLGRAKSTIMSALFPSTATARGAIRTFMQNVGKEIVDGYDRFVAGSPIFKGKIGAIFQGIGDAIALIGKDLGSMFMRLGAGGRAVASGIVGGIRQIFLGFGDIVFGPGFMGKIESALTRAKGLIKNLLTPKGMGIVANPKAFAAFDTLAESVESIAKKASKFKKFGAVFDDLGKMVMKAAKPFTSVSGAMSLMGRAARVIPGPLKLIALGFASIGFDKLVSGMWDAIGGFDGIKGAWDRLKSAFDRGGMAAVMSELGSMVAAGFDAIKDSIANIDWSDVGANMWDWLVDSVKNITWQDIVMALIVGLGLVLGGIPGILLAMFGPMIWSWIADATKDITWGDIGNALMTGMRMAMEGLRAIGGWFADLLRGIDWGGLASGALSALASFGSWVLDKIRSGISLLDDLAGWFGDQIRGVDWAGLAQSALNVLSRFGNWVLDKLKGAAGLARRIAAWFEQQMAAVNWGSVAKKALNVLARFGDWVLDVIKKASALDDRILEWFGDQISGVDWGGVAKRALKVLARFGDWVLERIKGAADLSGRILAWFGHQMAAVNWGDVARTSLRALARFGDWVLERIKGGDPIQRRIIEWASQMFRNIKWGDLARAGLERLERFGDWVLDKIKGAASLGDRIQKWIASQFDGINWKDAASSMLDTAKSIGKDIFDGLIDGLEQGWSMVSNWLSTLWAKIKGQLMGVDPGSILMDIGRGLLNGLWDGLKEVWDSIVEWFDGIIEDFKGKWNGFAEAYNNTIGKFGPDLPVIDSIKEIGNSSTNADVAAQALLSTIQSLGTSMGSMDAPAYAEGDGFEVGIKPPETMAQPVVTNPFVPIVKGSDEAINAILRASKALDTEMVDAAQNARRETTILAARVMRASSDVDGFSQSNIVARNSLRDLGSAIGSSVVPAFTSLGTSAATGMATAATAITTGTTQWSTRIAAAGPSLGLATMTAFNGVNIGAVTGLAPVGTTLSAQGASWGVAIGGLSAGLQLNAMTAFGGVDAGASVALTAVGTTITTQSAAWGASMSSNVSAMVSNTGAQFAGMSSDASGTMSDMASSVGSAASGMAKNVGSIASSMQQDVNAKMLGMKMGAIMNAQSMQQSTVQHARTMQSGVQNSVTNMALNVAQSVNGMRSSSVSQTANMASQIVAAMRMMASGVRSTVSSAFGAIAGIIASSGGAAIAAARSVGAAIGAGLAAGILSMVGAVASASAQLVSAASGSFAAAAIIGSPSRLFMWHGEDVGRGAVIGVRNMIPAMKMAVTDMVSGMSMAMARTVPGPRIGMPVAVRNVPQTGTTTTNTYIISEGAIAVNEAENGGETARDIFVKLDQAWDNAKEG